MNDKPTYAPINVKKNDKVKFFCLNVSANAEKLIAFIQANKNAKGFINLQIKERRETSQYGETHSAVLNAWEPDKNAPQAKPASNKTEAEDTSEVPF